MYIVTFADVDKKIMRSNKALKPKYRHSLKDADELLKEIYESIDGSTKLTVIVSDSDNEIDYGFENVSINSNSEPPDLLEILEDDIITSGHEDAQKIINDLEKQYQTELENERLHENQATKKGSKKGFNLLGRFKKSADMSKESIDDFAELDESAATSYTEDFAEIKDEDNEIDPVAYVESEESIVSEMDSSEDFASSFTEMDNNSFEDNEEESIGQNSPESNGIQEKEEIFVEETYEEDVQDNYAAANGIANKDAIQKKNEKVNFPAYESYLDLSQISPTIDRHKERFEKEHLIKFLGINTLTAGKSGTDLNSIMFNYAMNMLDASKFVLLRDYLHNSIEQIKDKTQMNLAQTYEKAMSLDYEEEATQKIKDDLDKIYSDSEMAFENYQNEQEEHYRIKLEKFEREQEKALEDFKKQQSLEKSIFIKDLETQKSGRISIYKDNVEAELNAQKEKLLDEKMYELKYMSINQLTETKRQSIRRFESELDDAVDQSWMNMQKALHELRNDIEAHIPSWKQELEEKRKREAEEREEKRKQEELELQRQRIELQRQQIELSKNGVAVTKEPDNDAILKFVEKKFLEIDEKLKTQEKVQEPNLIVPPHQENNQQISKGINKKTKTLVAGGALAVLLGSGAFVGHALTNNDHSDIAEAKSTVDYDKLSNKLNALEGKINTKTSNDETSRPSLDSLLSQKQYEEAMRFYKDKESLKKIEEALYEDKDLATLIVFNKTFDNETDYGSLDEAILSKDTNKVIKEYKNMSDKEKEGLSKERKAAMALLLYEKNEKKLANEILGIKK